MTNSRKPINGYARVTAEFVKQLKSSGAANAQEWRLSACILCHSSHAHFATVQPWAC